MHERVQFSQLQSVHSDSPCKDNYQLMATCKAHANMPESINLVARYRGRIIGLFSDDGKVTKINFSIYNFSLIEASFSLHSSITVRAPVHPSSD